MARIVSMDPRSTTFRNLKYLEILTNLRHPQSYSSYKVRSLLPVKTVPEKEQWRLGLLTSLMKVRAEKYRRVQDNQQICAMIDSLAST